MTRNEAARAIKATYRLQGSTAAQALANKYLLDNLITVEQYVDLAKWSEGRAPEDAGETKELTREEKYHQSNQWGR